MAPFRDLVKPNASFLWNNELELLFKKCKEKIIQQVCDGVRNYDTCRITVLQTDYSKSGLGYLLLQKHCVCPLEFAPVCCHEGFKLVFAGSRFTKGAEEMYAPTEGELLAVAWALNHARVFTQGCPNLIISTDHKPLLGILNEKPLEKIANPRIVRLKEKILPYSFSIKYNRGKWHRGPDALSRAPQIHSLFMNNIEGSWIEDDSDAVLALSELDSDGCISIEDIKSASASDPVMIKLAATIESGFPTTQNLTDSDIHQFFNVRKDLWIQQGVVMFKNRLVVPKSLRGRLLGILHSAHQGVDGMSARASNSLYWPGINASIRQKRDGCRVCNTIAPSQARESLQLLPHPDYPFQQLCMDAFEVHGNHYLAAVDRYSNWLLVFHIRRDPKASHVIQSLRSIFMTYGTPQQLFTDGGLIFQAQEVQQFLSNWKVEHTTSAALYPQGNGRAELAVKTAKRILQENTASDGSLSTDKACRAFLQYRNTPIKHIGLSPSQILFNRKLRDGIPMNLTSLIPQKTWTIAAHERENAFSKRNRSLVNTYNHSTRDLDILDIGTEVLLQDQGLYGKRWRKYGTVVDRVGRKYFIRIHGSGRIISKNRRFIKKVIPRSDIDDILLSSSNTTTPNNTIQHPDTSRTTRNNGTDTSANAQTSFDTPDAADNSPQVSVEQEPQSTRPSTVKYPRMLRELLPHNKPGLNE